MSRLDELIAELCPDGVEYIAFSEIADYVRGLTYGKGDEINNDFEDGIPVLRANNITLGQNELNFDEIKYVKSAVKIKSSQFLKSDDILICAGSGSKEHVGKVAFIREDMENAFGGFMAVIRMKNPSEVMPRFMFHNLTSQRFRTHIGFTIDSSTINNLNAKVVCNFKIPVPPVEVQQEIVRVLDNFTFLSVELSVKLSAELSARKKQLAYYRSTLIEQSCVMKVKLSEIVDIYLGLTATPNYTDCGVKFISAQNTSSDVLDLSNVKYISEEDYERATNNAKPRKGDLLFTRVGSNLGHPVVVDTDERLCIFVSLGFLRVKNKKVVLIDYLKHWMNTELFWEQVRKNVHGAAKVNLNTGWLKEFEIQLPSIEDQRKIVDSLNKLESLYADNSVSIPAEIEKREQQYRYYRDALLAFKELSA